METLKEKLMTRPDTGTTSGGLAGAVTVVLFWVLGEYAGIVPPPEVASATTLILMSGFHHLAGRL